MHVRHSGNPQIFQISRPTCSLKMDDLGGKIRRKILSHFSNSGLLARTRETHVECKGATREMENASRFLLILVLARARLTLR